MILCELTTNRLVTSSEMFLSQGHPIMKAGPGSTVENLPDNQGTLAWGTVYDSLSRKERLQLLGNGMHMVSTGAFLLWALSSLVHVDDLDFKFEFLGEHRLALSSMGLSGSADLSADVIESSD